MIHVAVVEGFVEERLPGKQNCLPQPYASNTVGVNKPLPSQFNLQK